MAPAKKISMPGGYAGEGSTLSTAFDAVSARTRAPTRGAGPETTTRDASALPGMVLPQLVALAVLGGAGYLLYTGGRELRAVSHVLANDPVPVRDLHGRAGPVEIEGTAAAGADGGTVTAPFSGTECLAYAYEVEELRSSGKHSSWHTLDEGRDAVGFVLEDDTGRVRVDPTGADLRLEPHAARVSPGDELPDHLARYLASSEAVERQDATVNLLVTELNVGNEQRFTERRLDVGEPVYVYGEARSGPAAEWGSDLVDAVVEDGPAAPVFVVSDTDERGTAWRFARVGLVRVGLGLALLLAVLVVGAGLVGGAA
jgi:hypothetical protein